jgi:hypothetical protein
MLPLDNNVTLLEHHLQLLNNVCDEIRICTRQQWFPLMSSLNLGGANVFIREPTSMLDAVAHLTENDSARFIVGMPDTLFSPQGVNPYRILADSDNLISIAAWKISPELKGKVGQISFDESQILTGITDKDPSCDFEWLWGAFAFKGEIKRDKDYTLPYHQFKYWLEKGITIRCELIEGAYHDIGTFESYLKVIKSVQIH